MVERASSKSYLSEAVTVLTREATAIKVAATQLVSDQLDRAIEIMLEASGKVVLIGSGKSGIAARKIAGTLTSTGTAAVFLHPMDALHGDLGILTPDDVAIAVSNSGETDEVLAVLEHLRIRGVPLIAIVGNTQSSLAKGADAVLDGSVDKEAGPMNLAPTSSTTVAMVLGDALAMILMKAKNFTVEDFALNHPGGLLGKRLTVTVGEVMHAMDRNPTVDAAASWMEVIEAISTGGLGAVSIVTSAGRLAGVITDGDVRRSMQRLGLDALKTVKASDVMTARPASVSPETLAYDALRLMEDRPSQISVLPVVEADGTSLGLVRVHDIVRAGLR